MRESIVNRAKGLLAECEADVRRNGFEGDDFSPTKQDLAYVTETLGTKLTAAEWRACGLAWVGSEHAMQAHAIEAKDGRGRWTRDVGPVAANFFASEEEAEAAIAALEDLGGEWAECEYRVVEA